MQRILRSGLVLFVPCVAAVLVSSGCGAFLPIGCTDSIEPGIVVEIYDAHTGAPSAQDARGWVRDGDFQEGLRGAEDRDGVLISLQGAFERPGTYSVHVEKDGYRPWRLENVGVSADVCHVQTVRLEARLVPGS